MKMLELIKDQSYEVRYWDEWEPRVLIYIGSDNGFYIFICPMTKIQFKVRPSSADIRAVTDED
tara:strand:+ start:946 stop:1134 length:189 start_codon:yes stop_codon:yes gene_type:complete